MIAADGIATRLADAVAPPEQRGVERDAVRLLVTDRASRSHVHATFSDLPHFLRAGDLLVVNDSATVPAALRARRTDGESLPLHVSTMIDPRLWMVEPRAPVSPGERLELAGGAWAVMLAPVDPDRPRLWYACFDLPEPMYAFLSAHGAPIRYRYVSEAFPLAAYQTIFAREPGSSEMPSAARPFSRRVVRSLRARGVEIATMTLHCGVSSFEAPERPGIERFSVSAETADAVNRARREGRRVIAVGTTAIRALESAKRGDEVVAATGWTDLVIGDGADATVATGLLTGFHDTGATHQWILEAFLDRSTIDAAYVEAATAGYLQHEFGDVHLLL